MKIAIASSGLGFIQRGIEAWAKSLAEGLYRKGQDVVLYHGGNAQFECRHVALNYRSRFYPFFIFTEKFAPSFMWRYGWKSAYIMEQKSFVRALIEELKQNPSDIIHTQDVYAAKALTSARQEGIISAKTILAHGTDESIEDLDGINYLQHLSPFYKNQFEKRAKQGGEHQHHFCVPNFVDTTVFYQFEREEQKRERDRNGIPSDCFVIGVSAALKISHKRIDSIIKECALLNAEGIKVFLAMAGAETDETQTLQNLARTLIDKKHIIFINRNFQTMPAFYNLLDLYVHPAVDEFFGIAIIEAMACGVPVVVSDTPVLKWIAGNGGWSTCMGENGFLKKLFPEIKAKLEETGKKARKRVEESFSWETVYPQFIQMYEKIMNY